MAEHARLARKLVGDRQRLLIEGLSNRRRQRDPAIRLEKMLHEEVQLPHELFAIERDAVRDVLGRLELGPLPLHSEYELDGLAVQRIVFGWLRHAEVRLQRDVAEVFQNEDAEIVGVAGDRWNRQRNVGKEAAHVDERQFGEDEGRVVHREYDRRVVRSQNAEILPRRRVAGERHDAHLRARELRALQAFVDSGACLLKLRRSAFHYVMSATTSSPSL